MLRAYAATALLTMLAPSLHAQDTARSANANAAPPALAATIMRLEREEAQAAVKRDSASIARIEPPDATFHYPDGTTGTGASDLQGISSVAFESFTMDSMTVRRLSPTVAVVTGRASIKGGIKLKDGKVQDWTGHYRFLDVWHQRGGRWQIAAEQYTRITAR